MKILINAVSAKSGGAASYIQNLAKELSVVNENDEYVFFVPFGQANQIHQVGQNMRVVSTDVGSTSSWKRFLWDQIILRRIVKKEKVDILLSSSDFGMLYPPCRQVLMVRNPLFFSNFYLETILPLKSLAVRLEFRMRRWLIVLSVKSSDIVITASHSMLSDVRRFISIPNGGAAVNRFGVPLEKFNEGWDNAKRQGAKEADRLQQKSLRMLYVSEYSDHKNFTTLLRAVLLLRERGVDGFCLTTTADPDQFPDVEISSRAADRALSSDARISPYIKFVGSVSYEYIHMLYHENDLFVFPSLAESFGHPLVEAMASGLPIIASDIPIHREICGEAALYFSPLDPQDLVSKILILSDNVQLREHLGKTGRARAATQFSWKEHVQRQIVILKELANKDLKSRA